MTIDVPETGPGIWTKDGPGARLNGDIQAYIGGQLHAIYDAVASEPIPDRFLKLLESLERNTGLEHDTEGRS